MRDVLIGFCRMVVCSAAVVLMTGCGVSTVEGEAHEMKSRMSAVITAAGDRQKVIDELLKNVGAQSEATRQSVERLNQARMEFDKAKDLMWTDMSNEAIAKMDGAMMVMRAAGDEVVALVGGGAKGDKSGCVSCVLRGLEEDVKARGNEEQARLRYNVQAKTFNEVIGLFPIWIGAKLLGESEKMSLQTEGQEGSAKARKLVEAALEATPVK